jgi:hypothetical protein
VVPSREKFPALLLMAQEHVYDGEGSFKDVLRQLVERAPQISRMEQELLHAQQNLVQPATQLYGYNIPEK